MRRSWKTGAVLAAALCGGCGAPSGEPEPALAEPDLEVLAEELARRDLKPPPGPTDEDLERDEVDEIVDEMIRRESRLDRRKRP